MRILAFLTFVLALAGPARAEDFAVYEKDVLPLLKQHCYKCHGDGKIKAGLRLTGRDALRKGGDSGPAIDEKNPAKSLLLKAINYKDGLEMPPTGKLPAKDIETITKWVQAGAAMPAAAAAAADPHAAPKSDGKDYWAYQPVRPVAPPKVAKADWVRNPIDAFILAKLEGKGLAPNPPADPAALVRRLSYDLTGLPPTPAEVDAFVAAHKADARAATAALVDRLLASPHYGEKWGRHWLDVVRFAETNGYERDGEKPNAWRYRDYVIRSFNADKPYDQFVREQLAGDEMPGSDPDPIIATGFYRLGLWDDEPADPLQALFDGYDDYVTTTGQAFLGMTVNCCRCHDHKIDPLPQADYYRLAAFFRDIRPFSDSRDVRSKFNLTDISPPEQKRVYEAELTERQRRKEALKAEMKPIEDAAIAQMPPEDQLKVQDGKRDEVVRKIGKFLPEVEKPRYTKLKAEFDALAKKPMPAREMALSVNNCDARPKPMHVMIRGNPHARGAEVVPGFPKVFSTPDPVIPTPGPDAKTSGRRTVLARWITEPTNPMTARVMVNRVWGWHFGRGIVGTPSDFGKFGEAPTHPELLDWLAGEFVRNGWSVKQLHRTILLSNTYLQSARANPAAAKVDPANHLLARFPMRRLLAEEVRDSILEVGGKLNRATYGKSIYPPIPKEVLAGQSVPGEGWHTSPPEQANRRSVYVFVKRSLQLPILATHDQADTDGSCPVRYTTTVPTQALGMLNGAFLQESAAALMARLEKEHAGDRAAQVRAAIRLTTGRAPANEEVAADLKFIDRLKSERSLSPEAAMKQYCLLALNANEFVYLD
ncbi:MAG: PSD1 and planctomycete cytochrome C domain-containing protein [Gemmataceae bacterium]|nr:PSD1 and planctomycete cytochrome C domain-containing protein [Gemmataceae bacterium]